MDQKQFTGNLDPKLKEVYERVMGTSFAQPAAKPQTSSPNIVTPPPPAEPKPNFAPQNIEKPVMSATFVSTTPDPVVNPDKKKGKFPLVFLLLGGLIFLAVYAFFWTKIFNLKLLFLP